MVFNLKKFSVIVMSAVILLSCVIPTYAQTNNAGAQADTFFTGTEEKPVSDGIWNYDAATDAWTYTSSKQFKNTWGYITNPWNDNKPAWFFFNEDGKMLTGWQKIYWNGSYKYFYFRETADGQRGGLFVNCVTPDGYKVDENGVWREDVPVRQYFSQTSESGSESPKSIKEETITIGDLLPDDFPSTDSPAYPAPYSWQGDSETLCQYCFGVYGKSQLKFITTEGIAEYHWYLLGSCPVTSSGDNYVYTNGEEVITFIMSEGKLSSIEVTGMDPYNGTYGPVQNNDDENLTIGDLLPDDFPTTPEDAWRIYDKKYDDDTRLCYLCEEDDEMWLKLSYNVDSQRGNTWFPIYEAVTETEDGNYVYKEKDYLTLTFVMAEGELKQIEYDHHLDWPDIPIGTYIPPIPPYEGPTIASILPDDFPTTDEWRLVPEGAWVADNGNRCYRESDKRIDFYHEGYDTLGNFYRKVTYYDLSTPVTKDNGNYIWGNIVFVMSDEDLIQIEFNYSDETGGVFTPPQKRKIGKTQEEFVEPEKDNGTEYAPHIYTPDDDPEFTPSFTDTSSEEYEQDNQGGNTMSEENKNINNEEVKDEVQELTIENLDQVTGEVLNPQDIESIDVLKGAAATAICGTKGAN